MLHRTTAGLGAVPAAAVNGEVPNAPVASSYLGAAPTLSPVEESVG